MLLLKKDSTAIFNSDPDRYYWGELRTRITRTIFIGLIATGAAAIGYEQIWGIIFSQIHAICHDLRIVSRSVIGPANLTVSLALFIGGVVACLWAILEIWWFVRPALYQKERNRIKWMAISFLVLAGGLQYLCFAFALPYTISCLLAFNQSIVEPSVDISDLLSFVLILHKGVLYISLWPYLLVFLMQSGWISLEQLKKIRPYIYVWAFFMGMIMTPPDVISQCIFAIPLILLYESVLMAGSFVIKRHIKRGVSENIWNTQSAQHSD